MEKGSKGATKKTTKTQTKKVNKPVEKKENKTVAKKIVKSKTTQNANKKKTSQTNKISAKKPSTKVVLEEKKSPVRKTTTKTKSNTVKKVSVKSKSNSKPKVEIKKEMVKNLTAERPKRKFKEKEENLKYIYGSAIAIFLILSNCLVNFTFEINDVEIYYNVFTIPFIYFFTCILYKKYGLRDTVEAMIIAVVVQILIFFLRWIMFSEVEVNLFLATLLAVPISQFICIVLYEVMLKSDIENKFVIWLILTIVLLFDNVVFLAVLKVLDSPDITLSMLGISNVIKVVMAMVLTSLVDKIKW